MKTCNKCGSVNFYANGACKACVKAKGAIWRENNKEKKKLRDAAYQKANSEKIKQYQKKWNLENQEHVKAYKSAYFLENSEKMKEKSQEWRAANYGRVRAAMAAWEKANKDRVVEIKAEWKLKNVDHVRQLDSARRAANPEAARINSHNRRARKRSSGGVLSKGLSKKLFVLQKGKCPCCSNPLGSDYHMDHKMPLALGGSNTDDNMQLLRARCNMQKNKKHPIDFMQSRGFLL